MSLQLPMTPPVAATNPLGRARFSELYAAPARPANHPRFVVLDPRAEAFHPDWDRAARETAAILRAAAGRDPHDRDLADLVGALDLGFNRLDVAADPGLTLFAYAAEPGSRSEGAQKLLGSWAATADPGESARTTGQS